MSRVLTAGICLVFAGFAALRAVRVPLTYDEAAAFFRYISTPALAVFDFDVSTNHFLNTLLTKASYLALGDSEFALRVPNLIGYALYLGFSLLIIRRLEQRVVRAAAFLLLNLNPYLLDYFALSRGYGLSLGLLAGALHFLFVFLAGVRDPSAGRHLSRALIFLCGAVMANFTLINVYAAVLVIALAAFVGSNLGPRSSPAPSTRTRKVPWFPLLAASFTLLVLSQDVGLSGALYEPVTVRLTGLSEPELMATVVQRVDIRGRPTAMRHTAGGTEWSLSERVNMKNVRIELPIEAAEKISSRQARIEVVVGSRPFWSDRPDGAEWASREAGRKRVLDSGPSISLPKPRMPTYRPIMNWRGDATYVGSVAGYTALALALLGLLSLALKAAGALAVRRRVLRREQWSPLAAGTQWLAAFAGTPLYLLIRESALYYGGTAGLVQDTVHSLIGSSFYGRTYHAAQNEIVFAFVLATFVVFGIVLARAHRQGRLTALLPGVCLVAIIVMVAAAELAARALFDTPYLLDRTALFLIPLYVLFIAFLFDAVARLGRPGWWIATATVTVMVAFSTAHFTATANTTSTRDWPRDASTKVMIADVEQMVAADRPAGSRVVLGVDGKFGPVAMFYARRSSRAVIDVVPIPRGEDFLYLDDLNPDPGLTVVRQYPAAHSLLARLR